MCAGVLKYCIRESILQSEGEVEQGLSENFVKDKSEPLSADVVRTTLLDKLVQVSQGQIFRDVFRFKADLRPGPGLR